MATFIQEISPEKARAAWTVILLGAATGTLVVTPLFVMYLFRRARVRERRVMKRPTQPAIDPWVEAGRRMTDRIDPQEDASTGGESGDARGDEAGDGSGDRSGNWGDEP